MHIHISTRYPSFGHTFDNTKESKAELFVDKRTTVLSVAATAMEDNPALPDQGPGEFPLQMEIEEDLEQEIENFVRLKRLGQYKKAHEMFEEVLTRHIAFFPVVAEYADLLLEQGRYGVLSKFLDIQIECMESVFEEDEVELLRIMRSLALIHTKGALRAALARASKTWMFLQRTGTKLTLANFPSDVQVIETLLSFVFFLESTSRTSILVSCNLSS